MIPVLVLAGITGCGPSYSPDTYASNAAQQANKVEQGIVVGVRKVAVSAAGTVGGVTGAAAGGIAGSQVASGPISAFTALGGSLVGGIGGAAVEHVTADTEAFEYIIRKPNGDLVSVTQKDKTPLALGQKVLVIAGTQARVVPDYTVPPSVKAGDAAKPDAASPAPKPDEAKAPEAKTPDAAQTGSSPAADTQTAAQPPQATPADPQEAKPPQPPDAKPPAPPPPATP
jgi:outer membrane lipoprotein SlyB